MPEITHLFKNRKADFSKLKAFGFTQKNKNYIYRQKISDEQFELTITITLKENIFTSLKDIDTNEEYILHLMPNTTGVFNGRIRQEYDKILSDINKICFKNNVFKSKLANKIIQHIANKYQDEPEFLWEKFPENAIFRRKDNKKWYAILLIIKKEKLGLSGDGKIEIIDVRTSSEDITLLADGKKYFHGYHMNKQHWLTLCLDGSVTLKEILNRLDSSYNLAKK